MRRGLLIVLALTGLAGTAPARTITDALAAATVQLETGCTGVLVERSQLVATAYHCVADGRDSVSVRLSDGTRHTAWVAGTNEATDQAVLFIPESVTIPALRIARTRPIVGTVLFFAGHPDRLRVREARLDRIGDCPSLPHLSGALFTSIDGVPGDSGAALVDDGARVTGLVHGGARCHIATPAATLGPLVDYVLSDAS